MSIVCQEFHCTPSEAILELTERNPAGFIERILELRNYQRSKRAADALKDEADMTPAIQRVFEIQSAIWEMERGQE